MRRAHWKIGIALGAGSARGLAHIGVLKVLEMEGIPVDYIAGSSIGAVIGACYACRGGRASDVEEMVHQFDWRYMVRFMSLYLPRIKTPEPEGILSFLRERLKDKGIENLSIPVSIVATDLFSGDRVVFKKGSMFKALSASIAIPGMFSPVYYAGRFLIDGGVIDPVPVDVVKNMGAEVVIGVDVSPSLSLKYESYVKGVSHSFWRRILSSSWGKVIAGFLERRNDGDDEIDTEEIDTPDIPFPSPRMVLLQAIDIMFRRITEDVLGRSYVDIVIRPKVGGIPSSSFSRAREIIRLGEEAAISSLSDIKSIVRKRWYHYVTGKKF
ncbi:MAG: patatin-like phospholipase family protein [Synergistetes bacterium]|nr:patatin-like phospholipase family protein [Synergistota bacterium]